MRRVHHKPAPARIARWACAALCALLAVGGGVPPPAARAETTAQAMPEYVAMLGRAIAFETVAGKGQVPPFAHYLAAKLESAGFPKSDIDIVPVDDTAALVVRYPGSTQERPILISGHMDVVPANAADWADGKPFELVRSGPYYYGRGVADMKSAVVAMVETFMRLKREGFVPRRELILALSGDEETAQATTAVLAARFKDAKFVLNGDLIGGGIYDAQRKPILYEVQTAEKAYADFSITAESPGGHSSEPQPVNAIYELAAALSRVQHYQFPVQSSEITRDSLAALGKHDTGAIAAAMEAFAHNPQDAAAAKVISADPAWVGQIRTTCVATMVSGGHARNALPERASANVNCRIFPGTSIAAIRDTLARVIANAAIEVTEQEPHFPASPASPINPAVMSAVAEAVHARFPGVDVVPSMSADASDNMFFRSAGVPSYGTPSVFARPGSVHMHAANERLRAAELPAALDFWYRLLTTLAQQ